MDCVNLASTPAYRPSDVDDDALEPKASGVMHLCVWGDNNPDRLLDVPRWLSEWALAGGPSFRPEKHCRGCPGYKPLPHQGTKP